MAGFATSRHGCGYTARGGFFSTLVSSLLLKVSTFYGCVHELDAKFFGTLKLKTMRTDVDLLQVIKELSESTLLYYHCLQLISGDRDDDQV